MCTDSTDTDPFKMCAGPAHSLHKLYTAFLQHPTGSVHSPLQKVYTESTDSLAKMPTGPLPPVPFKRVYTTSTDSLQKKGYRSKLMEPALGQAKCPVLCPKSPSKSVQSDLQPLQTGILRGHFRAGQIAYV